MRLGLTIKLLIHLIMVKPETTSVPVSRIDPQQ